ncbi:MAG: amino acid permease [Desulfotalea sp.]
MEKLQKKYGFWTASAMVVGIVIGSGVFFKADDVLNAAGGSLPVALLAWAIGAIIMISSAYIFAQIAARSDDTNAVSDYYYFAYGSTAGYLCGWFLALIYYPTLIAVLAWVSANYTVAMMDAQHLLWPISFAYLTLFFLLNVFSPVLAGKWQVSATAIKLIPLVLIAVFGTISGLATGQSIESFSIAATNITANKGSLAMATLATAFAYEGWILATSINGEIKDAKKNLPRALVFGTVLVSIIYMTYYIGISGVLSNNEVILLGNNAPVEVISSIFGNLGGVLLTVFVIISCLGTLNGLIMASTRAMYVLAVRKQGPAPGLFSRINIKTNSTLISALFGYIVSLVWLAVWYGNFANWFNGFLDISELPIAFLYTSYIVIHLWYMRTYKQFGFIKRFIIPSIATAGSCYIIWGASQKDFFLTFTIIMAVIFIVGLFFRKGKFSL